MPARTRRFALMTISLLVALALTGWFLRPLPPRYTVTDLGVLPGATVSGASGINNRGDVVGLSGAQRMDRRHAFLYRDGVMTDLGRFGLIGSHGGPAINDRGQVTGVAPFGTQTTGPGQKLHAFLYDTGGMHDLGTPPGYSIEYGGGKSTATARSSSRRGENKPGTFLSSDHTFLTSGGRTVDIGVLPGGSDAIPTGINAGGQVVGYCERRLHSACKPLSMTAGHGR